MIRFFSGTDKESIDKQSIIEDKPTNINVRVDNQFEEGIDKQFIDKNKNLEFKKDIKRVDGWKISSIKELVQRFSIFFSTKLAQLIL